MHPECKEKYEHDWVDLQKGECDTNYEIDCDYFFSEEISYMKPKPNPKRSDCDYSLISIRHSR